MTDFAEVKISQFSPVPGKPVRKSFNKNPLHPRKHSPIVSLRHGGVAQLGERLTGSQEVRGSIPLVSTIVNARPLNRVAFLFVISFDPHLERDSKWECSNTARLKPALKYEVVRQLLHLLQKVHNQRDHRFLFFRSRLGNHERDSNKRAVCDSFI